MKGTTDVGLQIRVQMGRGRLSGLRLRVSATEGRILWNSAGLISGKGTNGSKHIKAKLNTIAHLV